MWSEKRIKNYELRIVVRNMYKGRESRLKIKETKIKRSKTKDTGGKEARYKKQD